MRREILTEYVKAMDAGLKGERVVLSPAITATKAQNEIQVTIKNYRVEGGFSHRIHTPTGLRDKFDVKGPMGKGLCLRKSGTHIAFTGVGVLAFMNLILHLIRKNLGLLMPEEDMMLDNSFKFVLYLQFPSMEKAVGIDFF